MLEGFRVVGLLTAFERIVRSRLLGLRDRLLTKTGPSGFHEDVTQEVDEIDAALLRLVDGTFGLCERCGRALGHHRLLAEPAARLCLACRASPPH